MKALTIIQPWATLVAKGKKRIETRSWNTAYRGPLAIHASKGFPKWARQLCYGRFFLSALFDDYDGRWQSLPTGMVIATCNLVDVVKIYADTEIPGKPELVFGDYSLGRYMWWLDNVKMLSNPVPAKGKLGLWNWDNVEEA